MKKFLIFVFVVILGIGGYIGGKKIYSNVKENKRIEEAKKGWYLEVITDEGLFVREDHDRKSNNIKDKDGNNLKLKKGEIYKITDYYVPKEGSFYWYQIELKDGSYNWVANTKSGSYIKDYNGTLDVATPTLKYNDTAKSSPKLQSNDCYKALDIDHITTDHLIIWDDRDDYKITWVVYHEVVPSEFKDQYWIEWTVTDASGKSASKVQKIVFEKRPDEDKVTDWFKRKK